MEKKEKNFYKKWWFWTIIIIILIYLIGFIYNNYNSEFNNYKKQSISILNKYKSGELTHRETSEKLDILSEKLDNEYYKNNKASYMFFLEVKLSTISLKLRFNELSNTEINNYIQEIKNIKGNIYI